MSEEFIKDDTDLSLLERTNFQVAPSSDGKETDEFVDDVEALGRDEVGLARSPWMRIALAIGAASFALGFGFILSLGKGNSGQVAVESTDDSDESELTLQLEETADSSTGSNRSDMDAMRSEIALLEQQLALASVDRDPTAVSTARIAAPESPEEQVEPKRTQPRLATQPVSSIRTNPRPTPVPAAPRQPVVAHTVPSPPARTIVRTVPAPTPTPTPSPSFSNSSRPTEPVDPQQAWLAASTAGVFGHMPPMEAQDVQAEAIAQEPESEYRLESVNYIEVEERRFFSLNEPVPGLRYDGPLTVPMGSSAKAIVVSPISWIGKGDQFILQTSEDIFSSSEHVVIPKDSLVVVQPVSIDESSGLAELAAVGIEVDGEVIPVDYQKIAIRGKSGNPLIAKRYGDIGSDIAANDLEMFAVGALSGIGEILTRPDSQTITTGALSSSSSTDFGDRNILGAILAGGTRNLTDRMADRNDERLDEIRSRGVIYYLPEGEEVQFYVNSEFQL